MSITQQYHVFYTCHQCSFRHATKDSKLHQAAEQWCTANLAGCPKVALSSQGACICHAEWIMLKFSSQELNHALLASCLNTLYQNRHLDVRQHGVCQLQSHLRKGRQISILHVTHMLSKVSRKTKNGIQDEWMVVLCCTGGCPHRCIVRCTEVVV